MKKIIKSKLPLISVIMPSFNAGVFLVESIESIRSQTYKNWELIIIDDASTDESYQILKTYQKKDKRIKVYKNSKRKGIGFCLNRAIKLCSGEFIARMDADDISLSDRFEKQLDLLMRKKDVIACGGQAAMIDPSGKIFAYKKFPTNSATLYHMIMSMMPIQHPILMVRSNIFKSYRYLENLPTAEDVDMLFYLLSKGKISNVDSIIYEYRKSDMSNGYHNVKETFFITFANRFQAIAKYKYHPNVFGIIATLCQLFVVSLLPEKVVVRLFERFRFEKPFFLDIPRVASLRLRKAI